MSRGPKRKRELRVKRMYEPGRLWQDYLEKAYARLISRNICVTRFTPGQDEDWGKDQKSRVGGKAR
jgi:hypothetical protein